jgi:hypothetical protein
MNKVNIGLCMAIIIAILVSCQANNKEAAEMKAEKNILSTEKLDTNERQFVCKANMEMQVKNCLTTINLIEQKTKEQKGFILKSELKKHNSDLTETVISADSVKQTATCNTSADMVLRVPDTALQKVLQYTESLEEQVKARIINNTDVSFDVKLNALNHNNGKGQTVVLNEAGDKENKALTTNESIVEDLRLKDAINFSTVGITLQQPEEILTTVVVNKTSSWAKGDSTFSRAWFSLQKGFFVLINIFIYLIQMWWLVPIFFIGKWGVGFGKKYFGKVAK